MESWLLAGWLGLLVAVRRYLLTDCDPTQARQSLLAAALLVMPLFLDHLCVGAFHVLMVWLMVAGLGRIGQNRPWSGGLMLGLAVWIKLLPLVGVAYLLLKRKWLPAMAVILSRSPQYPRLTRATAVWWIASMGLMGWPWARAAGVTLWTSLLLGVVLLWTARNSEASGVPAVLAKPQAD